MKLMARFAVVLLTLIASSSFAARGGSSGSGHGTFGLNVGTGVPFTTEGGLNIYFTDNFGLDIDYGTVSYNLGIASGKFSMPSVVLKWHPFGGAFFLGAGAGQESVSVTAYNPAGEYITVKADATAPVAKIGWMWGATGGGLWFGIDYTYIGSTSGDGTATTNITNPNDQAFADAADAVKKFTKDGSGNFTFARIGYLF